jgi:pyruvate formate lyase activating enzyme
MTEKKPLIFDIQRGSTVDGPGLRTTVFFKGCNLRCRWCHNPEGICADKELFRFREKCTGCGVCRTVCKNQSGCILCGECARLCPFGAVRLYGRYYSPQDLYGIIAADRIFYDETGGGVTFSGGECMLYPNYLEKILIKCRRNGINTAIDTAGNVPYESFKTVLP